MCGHFREPENSAAERNSSAPGQARLAEEGLSGLVLAPRDWRSLGPLERAEAPWVVLHFLLQILKAKSFSSGSLDAKLAAQSGCASYTAVPAQLHGCQLSFPLNPRTRGEQVEPCWASLLPTPTAFHLLFQTDKHEITSVD